MTITVLEFLAIAGTAWLILMLPVVLVAAYRLTRPLEGYLHGSEWVDSTRRRFQAAGFVGMAMRFSIVSSMVLSPAYNLKKGFITCEMLEKVPAKTIKQLKYLWLGLNIGLGMMAIGVLGLRLFKWFALG